MPWQRLQGLLGVAVLLAIAWTVSSHKKKFPWRIVLWGIGSQLVLALVILKTTTGALVFDVARKAVAQMLSFTDAGAGFVFGRLHAGTPGLPSPASLYDPATQTHAPIGVVVAFHVLPVIIFFSAVVQVLYHLGIMQRVIQGFAWFMRRTMKISGAESLSVAANVFIGQVEAPISVKPFVAKMTASELNLLMVGGFSTVAGSVLAAYVGFGIDAGHLLAASVMSAPAAVVIAKIMLPEIAECETSKGAQLCADKTTVNVIDAAAAGALQGLKVAAVVGGMLIAFIALIEMVNYVFGLIPSPTDEPVSLELVFGYLFAPIAWCLGVEATDMMKVGQLLGTKIAVNEFVGYLQLASLREHISARSFTIATYALCGFANFGSIAIQIGGIGGIAPERRADLARLGLRAMLGGALASWLTASIAGIMIDA